MIRLLITYITFVAIVAITVMTGWHWLYRQTDPAIRECFYRVLDDAGLDAMFFAEYGPMVLLWALIVTFMLASRGGDGE